MKILNFDRTPRKRSPSMIRVELPQDVEGSPSWATPPRVLGIAFKHYDYIPTKDITAGVILCPTRRATKCALYEVKGVDAELIAEGDVRCSHLDNFHKETGRKLSLKKALEVMGAEASVRAAVWQTYHGRRHEPQPVDTLAQIRRVVATHSHTNPHPSPDADAIVYAQIKGLLGYGPITPRT